MFPATMIHRSGAAQVRVNSQEDVTRLGPHWHMQAPPEPSGAVVEAAAVVVPAPVSRNRGRPRKGA